MIDSISLGFEIYHTDHFLGYSRDESDEMATVVESPAYAVKEIVADGHKLDFTVLPSWTTVYWVAFSYNEFPDKTNSKIMCKCSPELLQEAEKIGVSRKDIEDFILNEETKKLVYKNTFFDNYMF